MLYTGQKPVDPLIFNIWPLQPGASSSYKVYEDSGFSVDYQRGVFARTPVTATQNGDTLRVEIGPVEGGYPGMMKMRAYQLRLPADWPPAAVTVNGVAAKPAGATGKGGWTFEGNTLTTVIPVASLNLDTKVTVEVRRAAGLTARRAELDGFAGAMTRLRGVYDAMHQTWPVSDPPELLVDAMQTGDRLGYHPERAVAEIAHFHQVLPQAQAAIAQIGATFAAQMDEYVNRMMASDWRPAGMDMAAEKQRRLDAMARAGRLAAEAAK
jgi:alpha-glucosidase